MINRRNFLKLAGLVAGSALPMLTGIWWITSRGDNLPSLNPYAAEPWEVTNPDGPVLLLINQNDSHPFGRYLAEILWAEGLNAFTAARLEDASAGLLAQYPCVILSAGSCSPAQVDMIAGYARGGGNLVVFQPDQALAEGLSLQIDPQSAGQTQVWTNPEHALAVGIAVQAMSVHVPCDAYQADAGQVIMWRGLKGEAAGAARPAVVAQPFGAGRVVAWGYDLAENVVLTRQGNPGNVEKLDELGVFRPVELFDGWIDFDQMAFAPTDEQQRLLANVITWLCRQAAPLPRLWYFTGNTRCLLVATSDSHRNTTTALTRITSVVEEHQGHITIIYTPPLPSDLGVLKNQVDDLGASLGWMEQPYYPSPSFFADLRAAGHEVTLHPYIHGNYIESWREYWRAFTRMGYGPVSPSVRTHDLSWLGWTEAVRIQAGFGIRMNLDYYHFGSLLRRDSGAWGYGHFNGSGLPMRFAEADGRVLEIYQQVTQLADDYFINFPWTTEQAQGTQIGIETAAQLIQSSLQGNFAAIACNFHSDPYDMEDRWMIPARTWLAGTLAAARDAGVPIWTAQHWLEFVTARREARFERLSWVEKKLAFDLAADEMKEGGLAVLLPLEHTGATLHRVTVDGAAAQFETWRVGGVDYGLVTLPAGSHHLQGEYL